MPEAALAKFDRTTLVDPNHAPLLLTVQLVEL
jgi:hypothetical protein